MVALPQNISPTVQALEDNWQGKNEGAHYRFIRGSQIGHPCERHLWYKFRWCHPPEQFSGRMLRLFNTGHREEARLVAELRAVGVDVQDVDPATQEQWEVDAIDGHFKGHADGILTGVLEAPKARHLFEAKTHNEKSFRQLVKHGVAEAKPEHVAQMQVYMGLLSLNRAFYLAKNKDTDALHGERIHFDPAHFAALMAKAERIKETHIPPARISDDPAYYLCKAFKCPSYDICHGGGTPLRNCRACLHSSPINDGQWYCQRHEKELPTPDQNIGCPHHRYLPGLINGEQIDVDPEQETITYRLPNGSEWVDGCGAQL